mmetsp:Transcript_29269/g.76690  ORF Transcript_29269/g.76690 Transcript_29269/m.76690 type:complete len:259 (-) Transcript_29269:2504-3280(-)
MLAAVSSWWSLRMNDRNGGKPTRLGCGSAGSSSSSSTDCPGSSSESARTEATVASARKRWLSGCGHCLSPRARASPLSCDTRKYLKRLSLGALQSASWSSVRATNSSVTRSTPAPMCCRKSGRGSERYARVTKRWWKPCGNGNEISWMTENIRSISWNSSFWFWSSSPIESSAIVSSIGGVRAPAIAAKLAMPSGGASKAALRLVLVSRRPPPRPSATPSAARAGSTVAAVATTVAGEVRTLFISRKMSELCRNWQLW